jgi:hypothetical protein
MGGAFSLIVPEEEQTVELAERFYQYHLERSDYDESVEDIFDRERFFERMEEDDMFMLWNKPTKTVTEAGEPTTAEILFEYAEGNNTVYDPEGLDEFSKMLETARENLSEEEVDVRDRTIEFCENLINFARENGYGVAFG